MPRLTEATRDRRRRTIADAAMRCFERTGFATTSIADIIGEAGSSAGSVYSNFSGKAEIVRFAVSATLNDLVADLGDAMPAERTPGDVFAHLVRPIVTAARAQTLVQIWAEVPRDPELDQVVRQSVDELRALTRDAVLPWCTASEHQGADGPEAWTDAVADAVLTALQGYLVRVAIDRTVDAGVLAGRIATVLNAL